MSYSPFFSVHTGTSLCFGRLQRCSQVAPALMCALVMLVKHCKGSGGTRAVPWRVCTCVHIIVYHWPEYFPIYYSLMSLRFLQRSLLNVLRYEYPKLVEFRSQACRTSQSLTLCWMLSNSQIRSKEKPSMISVIFLNISTVHRVQFEMKLMKQIQNI